MGAGKFGPPGWQDDADWTGWWGPNPPFHTPSFGLTHRPRSLIEIAGGTTFHFLDASPAKAADRGSSGAPPEPRSRPPHAAAGADWAWGRWGRSILSG